MKNEDGHTYEHYAIMTVDISTDKDIAIFDEGNITQESKHQLPLTAAANHTRGTNIWLPN